MPHTTDREQTFTSEVKMADRNVGARDVRNFKYSIIVPVFNGADKLDELIERTEKTFSERGCIYEVVIVDDGSSDNSWTLIQDVARKYSQIIGIKLTQNFGQHPAVLCGLANCSGDYALTIDADLQNPPEELFKLIDPAVERDLELIFAKFAKKQHAAYRNLGSKVIAFLNTVIFDKPKDLNISNVRIMNKELVQRMCEYPTAFPYINGLALRCSDPARRANVVVEHHKRVGSESTYTAFRIAKLVCTILFNMKGLPRLITGIGYGAAWFSFILGTAFVAKHYFLNSLLPETTPIIIVMAFCNCLLAACVGLLGQIATKASESIASSLTYKIGSIVRGG